MRIRSASRWAKIRARTTKPINLNFFCHTPPVLNNEREARWRETLAPYYRELGDRSGGAGALEQSQRRSMRAFCDVVEEIKPEVVSFHFGLPEPGCCEGSRPRAAWCISSATTAAEARWLEARGVDAVIAQGYEAGGHRGMFLTDDVATQVGTFALVPQIVDAVEGAGDRRRRHHRCARHRGGVRAWAPPACRSAPPICGARKRRFRRRIAPRSRRRGDDGTALTNLMTGRPARGIINRVMREIGPMSDVAPEFPLAAGALAPLRAKAEAQGSGDFSPMWAGQAASLGRALPAGELTKKLAAEALERMRALAAPGSEATRA